VTADSGDKTAPDPSGIGGSPAATEPGFAAESDGMGESVRPLTAADSDGIGAFGIGVADAAAAGGALIVIPSACAMES
jgi:hypothetical protein